MAAPQELATDLTGVTQEPPVGKQKEDDLDVGVTQKTTTHLTCDTQEPPVENENDEAITEQQSSHPMEPATATEGPVTLTSLQEENEFLKFEIEAYKQELTRAREAYEKEINLYMLAQVASATEKSAEKDRNNEYMCSECGDFYSRVGYMIIEVPLPGSSPVSPPIIVKKEYPTITQEPAGSSKTLEEEIKPPWPTLVVTEQKPVPKSFKTTCT